MGGQEHEFHRPSLLIREMQNKTPGKWPRSAESKEVGRQSVGDDGAHRELSRTAGGTGNGGRHPGKQFGSIWICGRCVIDPGDPEHLASGVNLGLAHRHGV